MGLSRSCNTFRDCASDCAEGCSMTRDEVLDRLRTSRTVFDEKLSAVPHDRLDAPLDGHVHTVGEIVWHVAAYDELMVTRLRAAHEGLTTEFDRDRVGWEQFNERVWTE